MNTKEMIEIMAAHIAGKKIEVREKGTDKWMPTGDPAWNWTHMEYRIAPEPKKEGRWERVEILENFDGYLLSGDDPLLIDALPRIPGFGGIDYQSPFNPKVIVRSMVPIAFSRESGVHFSVGIQDEDRPGIPVAAWFWREGE